MAVREYALVDTLRGDYPSSLYVAAVPGDGGTYLFALRDHK